MLIVSFLKEGKKYKPILLLLLQQKHIWKKTYLQNRLASKKLGNNHLVFWVTGMPIQECWQQQNGSCKMKANHCASALNPILCVSALPTNFLFKGSSFMMNPDFLSCVREGPLLLISVLRSCDFCANGFRLWTQPQKKTHNLGWYALGLPVGDNGALTGSRNRRLVGYAPTRVSSDSNWSSLNNNRYCTRKDQFLGIWVSPMCGP